MFLFVRLFFFVPSARRWCLVVLVLISLDWRDRGSNPLPPVLEADVLPPRYRDEDSLNIEGRNIRERNASEIINLDFKYIKTQVKLQTLKTRVRYTRISEKLHIADKETIT